RPQYQAPNISAIRIPNPLSLCQCVFSTKITISSSSTQTTEHIVLFNAEDETDPSKLNATVNVLMA
ncbi:hypothetical protein TorRG33x02_347170, partial [Trema orientale]